MEAVSSLSNGLNMERWWKDAACKGLSLEALHVSHCYDCPVQWECLWSAIDLDDRLTDQPTLIRGGLSPIARAGVWSAQRSNKLRSFTYAKMKALDEESRYRKQVKAGK